MPPSRTRLVCRAHNRFTPATALWEHFVGPHLPNLRLRLHQHRFSSTATEPAHHGADADNAATGEVGAKGVQQEPGTKPALNIRRMTTAKGHWLPHKVDASIAKNKMQLYASREVSLTGPEKLLAVARAAFEDSKEYEGLAVKPMVSTKPIKESALPWCLRDSRSSMPAMDVLDKEIEKFYKYTKPTEAEQRARQHLVHQVRSQVQGSLKGYDVEVFGSERNGIAFATSDIDFRLMHPSQTSNPTVARLPPTKWQREQWLYRLQYLFNRTIRRHEAYFLPVIRYARYPLISAQDRNSGLDIQIVLSNDTSLSNTMVQNYMDEIPYLRKLYYVAKNILDVRGLSDVYRGGIGSYSIFMMLVASIKHMPHERQDAAGALLNFLNFYSIFDTKKHGISIEPVGLFDKAKHPIITKATEAKLEQGKAKPLPSYMLSLRDPADATNDLGRKGIAIKHVQATFSHLYDQLNRDIKANTRPSLLAPSVGPSYMLNLLRRQKLQRYGERLQRETQQTLAEKAKLVREADREGMTGSRTNTDDVGPSPGSNIV
ncbi:Terminal nucleotidyltransferase 4A [Curvularia clavata]|uniref:polynucleotide adenylyltransferase n=1 Tax=Curvularia clavata TaxID=95742 RepID=A0A9Q8Z4P8_CURCL|nr:Terminal nucleotidyltransferase 4A [Curvularia clavata]